MNSLCSFYFFTFPGFCRPLYFLVSPFKSRFRFKDFFFLSSLFHFNFFQDSNVIPADGPLLCPFSFMRVQSLFIGLEERTPEIIPAAHHFYVLRIDPKLQIDAVPVMRRPDSLSHWSPKPPWSLTKRTCSLPVPSSRLAAQVLFPPAGS